MCDFEQGEKLFESKQMMKRKDKKEKHQSYKNTDPAYFLDKVPNKASKK